MDDLPPLPASAAPSRASSRQSSSPDLSESNLYIRDFVHETRQRLNFTSTQLPILDDTQCSELSDGETILLPLCCSALNALASMTRQLDTITTQLGTLQGIVATLPTTAALDCKLSPIYASLRDLSQSVSGAPHPQAPAPTRPSVPLTGTTTHPMAPPPPPQVRTKTRAPPRISRPHHPSIRTYPGMTRTPAPFTAIPRRTRRSSLIHGKPRRFVRESTPTLPLSSRAISPPTAQRPNCRTPRLPLPAPQRIRRISALSRLPKSCQLATPSLFPKDQSRSRPLKEDSTLPVPPPPSTRKLL